MQELSGDWTHIDSPDMLAKYAKAVANGLIEHPLFVIGPGGTGKSETFRKYLPEYNENDPDHAKNKKKYAAWMEGTLSPVQFYLAIARHPDRTLISDDTPDLQKNPTSRALLKQLCNTRIPRRVVYDKAVVAGSPLDLAGVDTITVTRSVLVVIANTWSTTGDDIQAVNTRAKLIRYAPGIPTLIKYAEEWLEDKDILRYLKECYRKGLIRRLHFRHLRHAQDYKRSGVQDWKQYLLRMFEPADFELLDDVSQIILRWAERNTDAGVFTPAELNRSVRALRNRRGEIDEALKRLVDKGAIHQLPCHRDKGDRTRKPSAVYALGPADKVVKAAPKKWGTARQA